MLALVSMYDRLYALGGIKGGLPGGKAYRHR